VDAEDRAIAAKVAEHGWTAIGVDDYDPSFVYSVGLMYSAKHPEIIIFGLKDQNYALLAAVIKLIEQGKSFAVPGGYDDAMDDVPLAVGEVHPSQHEVFLGYAMAYCRHRGDIGGLRAVQVFWPDREGKFPFDPDCEPGVAIEQPLLHVPADDEA
jgi:Domain of unknown function (DUF4262)